MNGSMQSYRDPDLDMPTSNERTKYRQLDPSDLTVTS